MKKGQKASTDNKYRYCLWREWDETKPCLVWVMLNPSTADDSEDDPTIRKCIGFAERWGYGKIVVVNLFTYRATHPRDLKNAGDLTEELNFKLIRNYNTIAMAVSYKDTIFAWGAHGDKYRERIKKIEEITSNLANSIYCLGKTKSGQPRHPLYINYKTEREKWKI